MKRNTFSRTAQEINLTASPVETTVLKEGAVLRNQTAQRDRN